ncbi:MAG: hypothetical protein M3O26_13995 [Pseudomonadota bacterium]|nr:hypothetical protein [Pseudomonadota bacterium]
MKVLKDLEPDFLPVSLMYTPGARLPLKLRTFLDFCDAASAGEAITAIAGVIIVAETASWRAHPAAACRLL